MEHTSPTHTHTLGETLGSLLFFFFSFGVKPPNFEEIREGNAMSHMHANTVKTQGQEKKIRHVTQGRAIGQLNDVPS